jgi:uncharacterized membrane protein YphA (DoxX/SURF4 family)
MSTAYVVVAAILSVILVVSGIGKLTGAAQVMRTLTNVGVPARLVPVLAALEFAGAVGLVVGIWVWPLGVAAAVAVILYFVGAVISHLRAHDREIVPPVALGLIALAALTLRVASI